MTLDDLTRLNGLVARAMAAKGLYLKHNTVELYWVYFELRQKLKADWGLELPLINKPAPPTLTVA